LDVFRKKERVLGEKKGKMKFEKRKHRNVSLM